jgi:hypothetical protein
LGSASGKPLNLHPTIIFAKKKKNLQKLIKLFHTQRNPEKTALQVFSLAGLPSLS